MLSLDVTITGIDDVQKVLSKVTDASMPGTITKRVATEVVLPKLAQYPSPSGRKQPFVSAKSRKYFFAALRSGQIAVPYRRSGDLGKPDNWAQALSGSTLTLTSLMKYSDLVRTKGKQAAYFKGVWQTDEEIAQSCLFDAGLVATAVLVETIGGAG